MIFLNDSDGIHFRILKDLTIVFLGRFLIMFVREAVGKHSIIG